MEGRMLIHEPVATIGTQRRRSIGRRRSSSSSDENGSSLSRTPSPASGSYPLQVGASAAKHGQPTKLSMQTTTAREFRFNHDARVAVVLLPALYIVADHAGFYAKLVLLIGFVAAFAFDEAQFAREHALMSVWMTVLIAGLLLWISFVPAMKLSPWNLLLAHNMTQVLFLMGVWGALQFPWIWRESPTIARLMERLLIGVSPFPCAVLFCWTASEAYGVQIAAVLSSFVFTFMFGAISIPLSRSESPHHSSLFVLGTIERFFHYGLTGVVPMLLFATARRASTDYVVTISGSLALLFLPVLCVHSLPFESWRNTYGIRIVLLRIGAGLGFCASFIALINSHPSSTGLMITNRRLLVSLVLLPIGIPALEQLTSAWSIGISITLMSVLIMFPPRHLAFLPFALGLFVYQSRYSCEKKGDESKIAKFGEQVHSMKEASPLEKILLVISLVIVISDSAPLEVAVESIVFLLSCSLQFTMTGAKTSWQEMVWIVVRFATVSSAVLIERNLLSLGPRILAVSFVVMSSLGVGMLRMNFAWISRQVSVLTLETKKKSLRKRQIQQFISMFSQVDSNLLIVFLVGRLLSSSLQSPLDSFIGMLIVLCGTVRDATDSSLVRSVVIRGFVQLVLCLFCFPNRVLGIVLMSLSTFYGTASSVERTGRSPSLAFALGFSLSIPLLSHLVLVILLDIPVKKDDWFILCGIASFGVLASYLDVLSDSAFPLICFWLVLLGNHASLVIALSTLLVTVYLGALSLPVRIGCLLGMFACQVYGLGFEKDIIEAKLDSVHVFMVLLVASRASFHRAVRWNELEFKHEFLVESILSRIFAIIYLFQGYFSLAMYRLAPLYFLPLIPFGLVRTLPFLVCQRLALILSIFVWMGETLLEGDDSSFNVDFILLGNQLAIIVLSFWISSSSVTIERIVFLLPGMILVMIIARTWEERGLILWLFGLGMKTIVQDKIHWFTSSESAYVKRRNELPAL